MLTTRVIPCLDVRDGRVVKGIRFQDLRDRGDPIERAGAYEDEGADEIVILDVSATTSGRLARTDILRGVRHRLSIPITVGGGVRGIEDAAALLEAGADRVSVNTAAVERPEIVSRIAGRFGVQCMVVAIDAARTDRVGCASGFEVLVRSGSVRTGLDAADRARRAVDAGAGEILLTSHDRDGTRAGYDVELLAALRSAVGVPIVASGGAANPGHMCAAVRAGADAVLAASIFHDAEWTVGRLKDRLARLGVAVRR